MTNLTLFALSNWLFPTYLHLKSVVHSLFLFLSIMANFSLLRTKMGERSGVTLASFLCGPTRGKFNQPCFFRTLKIIPLFTTYSIYTPSPIILLLSQTMAAVSSLDFLLPLCFGWFTFLQKLRVIFLHHKLDYAILSRKHPGVSSLHLPLSFHLLSLIFLIPLLSFCTACLFSNTLHSLRSQDQCVHYLIVRILLHKLSRELISWFRPLCKSS